MAVFANPKTGECTVFVFGVLSMGEPTILRKISV
eukprot:SAG11_NODE_53948_length_102_cov_37.666667_1_plen_33_part_11